MASPHEQFTQQLQHHTENRPKRLLISGGTGLVGSQLQQLAREHGHHVSVLTRHPNESHHIHWDPAENKLDLSPYDPFHSVIHLAGANIASQRWSPERKQIILESRTKSTQLLAEKLAQLPAHERPQSLICASGISATPNNGQAVDESHPLQTDMFLGQVVKAWEAAAQPAAQARIRTAHIRLAPVLSPQGGILKKLLPIYNFALGGPIGDAQAPFAWISLEDVARIFLLAAFHPHYHGGIHATTPHIPSRAQFNQALAAQTPLKIAPWPIPAFAIRLLLGNQMANETALAKHHPIAAKLQQLHFPYLHPKIRPALDQIIP